MNLPSDCVVEENLKALLRAADDWLTPSDVDRACASFIIRLERERLREGAGKDLERLPSLRTRLSPRSAAVAALFLGALTWLLVQPHNNGSSVGTSAPGSQEEEIGRLIGELGSDFPLRKDLARVALLRYGGTSLPALERSGKHPDLVNEIRGVIPQDRALRARLSSSRVTIKRERAVYTEILALLEPHLGAVTTDFSEQRPETSLITLNLENATLLEAVEGLAAQMKVPFGIHSGALVLGKQYEPAALAPVRFPVREAEVAQQIANLSTESWAPQKEAEKALGRLGFGAERALWSALDAASPKTREIVAELLRNLYRAPEAMPAVAPPVAKEFPLVTINAENRSLAEVVSTIVAQCPGVPIIWDGYGISAEERISFLASMIRLDAALRLLLTPRGGSVVAGDDCILIMTPGNAIRRSFPDAVRTPPPHALWLEASRAQETEARIADLASMDRSRQERASAEFKKMEASRALAILACAAGYLEGDPLRRCQGLRQEIASEASLWICDLPSGVDLQTLNSAQRAILDAPVAPMEPGVGFRLEQILENEGVRATFNAHPERVLTISGKGLTLSSLLKITLRPNGYDFYLNGKTVIVDTSTNVRAALGK
jgi:hypothetical protein